MGRGVFENGFEGKDVREQIAGGIGLGAAEAIATVMSLNEGIVTPTINLTAPDPECDLNYVPNKAVRADISCALSSSLGFGGHNAVLAFRKV